MLALACAVTAFAETSDAQPASGARPPVDQSIDLLRWTVSLEAVAFSRSNSVSQVLVSRLPGATTTFGQTQAMAGSEAFNSNQFDQGHSIVPRLTLRYQADANHRFELSYLAVLNLNATRTTGPDNPVDWYVMRAPGFWQTQDFYYQGMTWASKTDFQSVEVNARSKVSNDFELLAGFRWLRLKDSLAGSLKPTDTNQPSWKVGSCATDSSPAAILASVDGMTLPRTAQACAASGAVDGYPPFWTTSTTNDLFGLQAGAEGTFLSIGRLSLGGVAKLGAYDNRARQDTAVSMKKQMYHASAQLNRLAFAGQGEIRAKYTVNRNMSVKVGYEMLWLDRVALAPGQIDLTTSVSSPGSVTATGVNNGSSVLLQGFTIGLEYAF